MTAPECSTNPRRVPMHIEEQARKAKRTLLKKKGLTAGEIAERAELGSGRGIAKALGLLVECGIATKQAGRKPTYVAA
jgi:sugar-specific transcriptional regulator TrmB